MKITAVILDSVEEQLARGDTEIIDPVGVKLDGMVPVFRNYSHRIEDIMGRADNLRVEDGRLLADLDLGDALDLGVAKVGVGGMVNSYRVERGGAQVIDSMRLIEVGVTWKHPPATPRP